MKKLIIFAALCSGSYALSFAQPVYMAKDGFISFFSAATLENIEGKNNSVRGILNTSNNEIHLIVPMRQFKFEKALMEEHFNENYVESDKFPNGSYDGKINEKIDFTKDGTYEVTSTGKLKIHGVEQERTEKGKLTVQGNSIRLECDMKVKVADFKIEIPKLVFQNIAEIVDVKMKLSFAPYKK